MLAALAFLVAVAFWPGIQSAAIAPRWAVMAVLVPLLVLPLRVRMTPAHWLGLAFIAYAALSLLWATEPLDGFNAIAQLAILAGLFCIGAEADDLPYAAFAIGVAVSAQLAVSEVLGSSGLVDMAPPAGLFLNKNILAGAAALALVACAYERKWLLSIGPAVAVVITHCHAAWLAVFVTAAVYLWSRSRRVAVVLAVIGVLFVSAAVWFQDRASQEIRIGIWEDSAAGLTVFGHGAGSFYTEYPAHASHIDTAKIRPDHAHSDYLEFVYEYGIGSLPLFAVFVLAIMGPLEKERLVLVCLGVIALVDFPLHLPATLFMGALAAGRLCGARYRVRHGVGDRRSLCAARSADDLEYAAGCS